MSRPSAWTPEQLQFLRDHYQTMNIGLIAKNVGKKPSSIYQKAKAMFLSKRIVEAKPKAAVIHKAPPSTDKHSIEPTPEVIPGLMCHGYVSTCSDWEHIKAMIESKKCLYGTYNDPRR